MPRLLPGALVAIVLLSAASAEAHVLPQPQFLSTGDTATLSLAGPNERDEPMTGFSVTVPAGLRIVHAHPVDGWDTTVDGATATWTGGSLEADVEEAFGLEIHVSARPGLVTLETAQLYADGGTVSWPVSLTILPRTADRPSQNLGWALAAALGGLLVTAAIVALAWRRRTRALQER